MVSLRNDIRQNANRFLTWQFLSDNSCAVYLGSLKLISMLSFKKQMQNRRGEKKEKSCSQIPQPCEQV